MPSQTQYDFLIVGAGLFGAVFARQMTDAGYSCLVLDKRNHIGGNTYTKKIQGIQVHQYGAHIFHTNDEAIWKYVNRFTRFNDYRHKVDVHYKGRLLSFPINLHTLDQLFDIKDEKQAQTYFKSASVETDKHDFESWAKNQLGEALYEIFIKGYTEKQWGRSATELPSSILKRIPVRTTYNNDYFDDKFQGIPENGYTVMVQAMLEGIEVRLGVDYFDAKVELDGIAKQVVYTGPIDLYYDYQFGTLGYRGLSFEHGVLDQSSFQSKAVVNYTEREIPYTRIIEHKKFADHDSNQTVITKEYPATWKKGDEAYYPINDEKNKNIYNKYKALSQQESKVLFGGRLGEYKYYDMHQVIASALFKATQFLLKIK